MNFSAFIVESLETCSFKGQTLNEFKSKSHMRPVKDYKYGCVQELRSTFDISNPLRSLVKSSLVWLVLICFGLFDFILGLHGFGLIWFG